MPEPDTRRPAGQEEEYIEPFVYPAAHLDARAPFRWLAKGWQDIRRAPAASLTYGAAFVLIGYLMTWLAWGGEANTLALFVLTTGFILIGPAAAFGLYSISRQLELGLRPRIGYCLNESRTHMRNELLFALVLLIILLVWARAATMVNIFVPVGEEMGWLGWARFLAIGSAVGSIFAALVFLASAFSLPMMLDRGTDAITSALTSANAVLQNKGVMLLWATLILGLVLLGFATAYLGLALVLPLIGHATWHAYRETIGSPDAPGAPASRVDGGGGPG
ncbi:MAG: DUF2189 domain-containing protein [Chromatiales bacterium]|jgi:uncharacterized membrane protein